MQELKIAIESRFRSIEMKKQGFQDENHFESTKIQFIEVISVVYGHPKRLIDAQLKDGTTDVVILTFLIMDNSRKDSLLMEMSNCSEQTELRLLKLILIAKLNMHLSNSTVVYNQKVLEVSDPVYTKKSGKLILRA